LPRRPGAASSKPCTRLTLVKTIVAVKEAGWGVDFLTVDGSYISKARNYFAHFLLRQPHFTHLVMIDSDMSVEGHVICRLVRCGKPVAAAAYSQRRMNMETFAHAARNIELAPDDLTALALEYNIQPEPEPGTRQVKVVDGMCRVKQVALGCSAIRRDAFESLIATGTVRQRPDGYLNKTGIEGPFYGFFDEITLDDGDTLSEDYSFCKRWRSGPGNEIWAVVDEPIGHDKRDHHRRGPEQTCLSMGQQAWKACESYPGRQRYGADNHPGH
jgi:hypothetical protein